MPDDLNNADVRALVAALHGVRHDLSDIKTKLDTNAKQSGFQDRAHTNAIDKLTARIDRLADRVERSAKLNTAVVTGEREAFKGAVREITGSIKLPVPVVDEAEITQRFLKRWLLSDALPWLAKRGFFIKLLAFATALAGAAWAWLAHKF